MNKILYNPILKERARKLRNKCTQSERELWKCLKGKKLKGYDFHRQKPVDHFILDFYCYKLMLGIELDGYTHNFEDVKKRDKRKERKLNDLGITILRFKDEEVLSDMDGVIYKIEQWIDKNKSKPKPNATQPLTV